VSVKKKWNPDVAVASKNCQAGGIMRTGFASSRRGLTACFLAVALCVVSAWPAQAITSNNHFTPAVTVTKETAYTGVFETGAQSYTGLFGGDNPVDNDDPSGHDYGDFSINLGSIYNLVLKDMLAQYDSATPDVMSGRNSSKPETFTIDKDPNPPGSQTFTAPGGETFLAPSGTDFRNGYKVGKAIPFKYDFAAIDRAVGHYGTFDYQRNKGQGEKLNNIFYTAYIHASNFGVGVYMNGAGYSLDGTITIASDFAGKSSSNAGDPNQKKWWTYGWNGAQSGNPGSSSH
jgi:hypothetical protein